MTGHTFAVGSPKAEQLRSLLREAKQAGRPVPMPCCGDALHARLIEAAGFELQFLAGFATAATFGLPDVEYIKGGEIAQRLQSVTLATRLPVIADADTGFGNAMNVRATVKAYAHAGAAVAMIEDQVRCRLADLLVIDDQVSPKRCGHLAGKQVVDRAAALLRFRAAADERRDGTDIVLVARTDARLISLDECIARSIEFARLGADILFPEALESVDELREYAQRVNEAAPDAVLMVNLLAGGRTPALAADECAKLGFTIAAYPLDLLMANVAASRTTLAALKDTSRAPTPAMSFADLLRAVGFDEYTETARQY